ncbi:hypothetical protein PCL_11478 [Purpureocillium lilacinum]|uniref:NECAP PHear domain-containing protein n=1 Tax=Purpureocillium lilacinum TaxID=33203 RepID=A0A2U3EA58_PURLI|nr:hypothetical protein PCL_11478 [Purpureocillium lilacinum]
MIPVILVCTLVNERARSQTSAVAGLVLTALGHAKAPPSTTTASTHGTATPPSLPRPDPGLVPHQHQANHHEYDLPPHPVRPPRHGGLPRSTHSTTIVDRLRVIFPRPSLFLSLSSSISTSPPPVVVASDTSPARPHAMDLVDPATGRPLPSDAIQRVLFVANTVHVYNIPPLTSMRGHSATAWTADPARHIFTARLRVIETSSSSSSFEPLSTSSSPTPSSSSGSPSSHLKVDLVLEDTSSPSTPQLFAAAPYTHPSAVEPVVDSSRFFAITVRDDQGRKAVLGIGFEDRSDAFDLAVALQEARRGLGLDADAQKGGQRGAGVGPDAAGEGKDKEPVKDYSLKEGETITVNLGSKFGRRRPQQQEQQQAESASLQSFALAPPPSSSSSAQTGDAAAGGFALPPPPTAEDVKRKRRSLRDLGFDDGQFGEFA